MKHRRLEGETGREREGVQRERARTESKGITEKGGRVGIERGRMTNREGDRKIGQGEGVWRERR